MYTKKYTPDDIKDGKCPSCSSKILRYSGNSVTCGNCGTKIGTRFNKYGAKRTVAMDGQMRDSKFEASVADSLYLRKQTGDIKDYESQYRVEIAVYRQDGTPAFYVRHKVDFRILHQDDSYELLEAKGLELPDYKWRRRLLEEIWLPENPDHIYTVITQRGTTTKRGKR